MEVYIFDKNKRCPYLHYAFLTTEIERYPSEELDWTDREHKVNIPFLYKWLYAGIDTTPPEKTKVKIVERITTSVFGDTTLIEVTTGNFLKEWFKITEE